MSDGKITLPSDRSVMYILRPAGFMTKFLTEEISITMRCAESVNGLRGIILKSLNYIEMTRG